MEELPLDVLKGLRQHTLDVCVVIVPEEIVGDYAMQRVLELYRAGAAAVAVKNPEEVH